LYGDDNGNERLPEYAVVDARVTYALTDLLSVYLSAENLLDRKYQILYDYPMPGRTLLGGVSWTAL
jgi:iron complex outermembrane receptor protein